MAATPTFDAALDYRERGWSVLPLRPGDKRPHSRVLREVHGEAKWKPFERRPPSAPEIRAWCGLSVDQARAGIEELRRQSILVKVGVHKRANLYRPGPGPATLQRAERRARDQQLARPLR